MTPDPWALQAHFYSIFIKREAVTRSFTGGVEEFERVHSPVKNGALFQIACMSHQDTEYVLAQLNDAGLIPGKDISVIDMVDGPLLECPGIIFQCPDDGLLWAVNVEVGYGEPEALVEPEASPAPTLSLVQAEAAARSNPRRVIGSLIHYIYDDDEDEGEPFVSQSTLASQTATQEPSMAERVLAAAVEDADPRPVDDGDWVTLGSREAHGAVDSWDEFLCAIRTDRGLLLDVFGYEWLGEVPLDWFDEDGELLPEHQDGDGDLKLPEELDGSRVTGHMDGGFVGELQSLGDDAVELEVVTEGTVRDALAQLSWHTSEVQEVLAGLQRLPCGSLSAGARQHTIRVRYIDSLLAAHGEWEDASYPCHEHSIKVSDETVAKIKAGEEVLSTGQGLTIEDVGLVRDDWHFNERLPGSVAICLDQENGDEPEWLEAVAVWINEEPQPRPKGYFE